MKNPTLIESISTDIIDEEQELESSQISQDTKKEINNEFEILQKVGVLQKDLSYRWEDIIIQMHETNDIPTKIIDKTKDTIIEFDKRFGKIKNPETKLSMIEFLLDNIWKIKNEVENYKEHTSDKEISDILKRQEDQIKQISKVPKNLMDSDNKISMSWVIWWVVVVCLVIFLIFKLL